MYEYLYGLVFSLNSGLMVTCEFVARASLIAKWRETIWTTMIALCGAGLESKGGSGIVRHGERGVAGCMRAEGACCGDLRSD